jgi:hypothetical protein
MNDCFKLGLFRKNLHILGHEVMYHIYHFPFLQSFLSYLAEISAILVSSVPCAGGQRGHTVDRR